jgi:hypothetical protein
MERLNMTRSLTLLMLMLTLAASAGAQDTLPRFTVKNMGNNKIIIGWVNAYPVIKQISIQRSFDSTRDFKTIMSVADPAAIQNGFADTKAVNDHMYYRLFINLDKGQFFFTEARQPARDTLSTSDKQYQIIQQKKDSLSISIKSALIRKPDFVPSFYVYTRKDGYVFINLPDADRNKYHIKFFEEDDSFLFEIKNIKDHALTLDKANFMHGGWFKFELYNEGKLIEKNKFFLAKEF